MSEAATRSAFRYFGGSGLQPLGFKRPSQFCFQAFVVLDGRGVVSVGVLQGELEQGSDHHRIGQAAEESGSVDGIYELLNHGSWQISRQGDVHGGCFAHRSPKFLWGLTVHIDMRIFKLKSRCLA
ncbi:hypothetical protein XCAW_b00043 (plasmid) [Xanthomonas citri subsp. citri Aw12879]|nr:hypothetical protein XCAW_b00043 [Xanthomonas citri subsp. citri Aw12879]ARR19090.1 hypothetical protein B7L65_20855 [Xanthomonas citri pv. citri]ARR20855.1 hypothetical protein B7L67_04065 [Xanthomonas citri pv. citri]